MKANIEKFKRMTALDATKISNEMHSHVDASLKRRKLPPSHLNLPTVRLESDLKDRRNIDFKFKNH
jgi:hypothetical protein